MVNIWYHFVHSNYSHATPVVGSNFISLDSMLRVGRRTVHSRVCFFLNHRYNVVTIIITMMMEPDISISLYKNDNLKHSLLKEFNTLFSHLVNARLPT